VLSSIIAKHFTGLLLAFPMMLQMWVFQVRLLEIVTPKYLASLTSSRICPFKEYLFSIDVLDLVSIQSDSKIKSRILLYGMVTTYQKEQR
jgi:hypothetical protein